MIIEELFKKFVLISMANGAILQGFLAGFVDEEFLELREVDNNIVYLRADDVSFVRLGEHKQVQETHYPEEEGNVSIPKQLSKKFIRPAIVRGGDYSMKMPTPEDDFEAESYKMPEFIRKTRRDENISEED